MIRWPELKQEHLIMQVLKFGEIKSMTLNVIFGLLVVLFMKCAVYSLLFKAPILMNFINQFKEAFTDQFPQNILLNYQN